MCKIQSFFCFLKQTVDIAVIRYRIVRNRKHGLSAAKKLFTETLVNPVVNGLKASDASGQLSNNPTTETIVLNCFLTRIREK